MNIEKIKKTLSSILTDSRLGNIGIPELKTPRLLLRGFRKRDLDDFYEYASQPNVGPRAGWKPHESKGESAEILDGFIHGGDYIWAIEHVSSGKVIGSIGLHQDIRRTNDKARSLGYVLSEDWWGMGLATEAAKRVISYGFDGMELTLISVNHYPFNNGSRRVIEKCGFHMEGTLRQAAKLFDGIIYNMVCYSLTKEEYKGLA